jgi:cytochrome oxidase Cu insertion factor (SCO1/SenC/PrrC family)
MKTLFVSLLVILLGSCHENEPIKGAWVGQKLPNFNILAKDSTVFNTQQIPEGKPVVLFYFTPYCPYCRAQLENITTNIDKLKDIRFYLLTSFPYQEMKSFYNKFGIDKYPNIIMGVDTANYFPNHFQIEHVPAIAIFNKDKRLNALFKGQLEVRQIREVAEQ